MHSRQVDDTGPPGVGAPPRAERGNGPLKALKRFREAEATSILNVAANYYPETGAKTADARPPIRRRTAVRQPHHTAQEGNSDSDVMGMFVPRRARTAIAKRPADYHKTSNAPIRRSNPVPPYRPTAGNSQRAPSPETETEKEHEVAEVLFDLANMFPPAQPAPAHQVITKTEQRPIAIPAQSLPPNSAAQDNLKGSQRAVGSARVIDQAVKVSRTSSEQGTGSEASAERIGDMQRAADSAQVAGHCKREVYNELEEGVLAKSDGPEHREVGTLAVPKAVKAGSIVQPCLVPPVAASVNPSLGFPSNVPVYYNNSGNSGWPAPAPVQFPSNGRPAEHEQQDGAHSGRRPYDVVVPPALRKLHKRCASHVYIARFIEWQQNQHKFVQQPQTVPNGYGATCSAALPDRKVVPAPDPPTVQTAAEPRKVIPTAPVASPAVAKHDWLANASTGSQPLERTVRPAQPAPMVPPHTLQQRSAPPPVLPPGPNPLQLAQLQSQLALMQPGAPFFFPHSAPLGGPPFAGPPSNGFHQMPVAAAGPLSLFAPPFGLAGAFPPALQQLAVSGAGVAPQVPTLLGPRKVDLKDGMGQDVAAGLRPELLLKEEALKNMNGALLGANDARLRMAPLHPGMLNPASFSTGQGLLNEQLLAGIVRDQKLGLR